MKNETIFTEKVKRLKYLTRMGFDNREGEKKKLMRFFSELERKQAAAEQLAAALDEVVNETEVYMPEDWWERARAALEAWKAAK